MAWNTSREGFLERLYQHGLKLRGKGGHSRQKEQHCPELGDGSGRTEMKVRYLSEILPGLRGSLCVWIIKDTTGEAGWVEVRPGPSAIRLKTLGHQWGHHHMFWSTMKKIPLAMPSDWVVAQLSLYPTTSMPGEGWGRVEMLTVVLCLKHCKGSHIFGWRQPLSSNRTETNTYQGNCSMEWSSFEVHKLLRVSLHSTFAFRKIVQIPWWHKTQCVNTTETSELNLKVISTG